MVVNFGVDRRLAMYVANMDDVMNGKAKWREVFNQSADIREVDMGHGNVYLRSALNAPRFKILKLKLTQLDLKSAETLLPESEGVLRAMTVSQDSLIVTRREGVNTALLRLPVASINGLGSSGSSSSASKIDVQKVSLPLEGNVTVVGGVDHPDLIVAVSSWTQALRRYVYTPTASSNSNAGQFVRLNLAPPVEPLQRAEIVALAEVFGAKIVDVSVTAMVIEMTGGPAKVDNFIDMVRPFGIKEMMRTGRIAMVRGARGHSGADLVDTGWQNDVAGAASAAAQ
jgi:acetolactate synthase small subunit